MSAAQQRNTILLAAALAVTALFVVYGRTPSRPAAAKSVPVVKKVKAKADPSPQALVLEGRIAPTVTASIQVPMEKLRMVAKLNEPLVAGAVVGVMPGSEENTDPVNSVAVRAPVRGILVEPSRGKLGIAADPAVLSAHTTVTAGDLARVHEGQSAEITVKGQAGPPLKGTVKYVGEVDGLSGAFPVEIAVQGTGGRIFAPMPASIRILP